MTRWLRREPGQHRAPAGLEWVLWRRLPGLWAAGTLVLGLVALGLWLASPPLPTPAEERALGLWMVRLLGAAVFYATLCFTVAIGCAVVMIMKGPAYEADPYPPADRSGF